MCLPRLFRNHFPDVLLLRCAAQCDAGHCEREGFWACGGGGGGGGGGSNVPALSPSPRLRARGIRGDVAQPQRPVSARPTVVRASAEDAPWLFDHYPASPDDAAVASPQSARRASHPPGGKSGRQRKLEALQARKLHAEGWASGTPGSATPFSDALSLAEFLRAQREAAQQDLMMQT